MVLIFLQKLLIALLKGSLDSLESQIGLDLSHGLFEFGFVLPGVDPCLTSLLFGQHVTSTEPVFLIDLFHAFFGHFGDFRLLDIFQGSSLCEAILFFFQE
jgi:hypothetical protein